VITTFIQSGTLDFITPFGKVRAMFKNEEIRNGK
jgi:hypothetical protein